MADYLAAVRAEYPLLPATQPLGVPLELSQAARFVLNNPIYLSRSRGDLWITRPDAPPTAKVLRDLIDPKTPDSQTHVVRERVEFVHWMPNDSGPAQPYLVCRSGSRVELISPEGRKSLPTTRDYQWDRAFSWNEAVVVPSRSGVSIFQFGPEFTESYQELITDEKSSAHATPEAMIDWKGLLAWVPWEGGKSGSHGAARFVDGKWVTLGSDNDWPERIVHLVPLRDGSVVLFVLRDDGAAGIETAILDRAPVDEHAIKDLVAQLGDIDPETRKKAFSELGSFGPGAWPVLEKLLPDQPPQAQVLLKQLLKDRDRPGLGGMPLLGRRALHLNNRLPMGGAIFYVPEGVSITDADGNVSPLAPAWLAVGVGDFTSLLPPPMVMDLKPDHCHIDLLNDSWVVDSDIRGPRLFYGNGFATLLRKNERAFSQSIGVDQRGRWLFRKPRVGHNPATAPADDQTLVLDPHLPDVVPRLPVWQLAIADTVGWDQDNWPVVKHGAAYALTDGDWRPIPPEEKIYTRPQEVSPPPDAPSTLPSTSPATRSTTQPDEPPILVMPDGTRYYGGKSNLKMAGRDGKEIDWPLPAVANGNGPVTLLQTRDGKLFLFNQPGRVLRIAPTPGGVEPFKLDAPPFTHNIPTVSKPTRIWLDPAGRIDIEWENRLAVLFPQGYIPRAITEKMVDSGDLDAGE